MNRTSLLCSLAVLAFGSNCSNASADTLTTDSAYTTGSVLYSGSSFVQGSKANVMTFAVPSAGELLLTLTDLTFPKPFSSIKFGVTDTSAALMGLAGPGTLSIDLTKPTTLYAEVFATTQASMDLGLYNLTATLLTTTPVPLPQTAALLLVPLLLLLRFLGTSRQPLAP